MISLPSTASMRHGFSTTTAQQPAHKLPKHTDPKKAPSFSGMPRGLSPGYQRMLNRLDFREFGASYLDQIKVIYATCIGWRLIAANERRKASPTKRWNEIRENSLRDSMGYIFWFFATPMLQRGVLAYITKKHDPLIGQSLYKVNQDILTGKGVLGKLKAWNPLYRIDIPSSEQVNDQLKQALHHLRSAGVKETEPAFKSTQAFYNRLLMYRNIATGLGLLNTIALIGIGISLLNIYWTNKNMERQKAALKQPNFPPAPPLPKPPQPQPVSSTPSMQGQPVNKPFNYNDPRRQPNPAGSF